MIQEITTSHVHDVGVHLLRVQLDLQRSDAGGTQPAVRRTSSTYHRMVDHARVGQALLDEGTDIKTVAEYVGHSSIVVTERVYARPDPNQVLDEVDTFGPRASCSFRCPTIINILIEKDFTLLWRCDEQGSRGSIASLKL